LVSLCSWLHLSSSCLGPYIAIFPLSGSHCPNFPLFINSPFVSDLAPPFHVTSS
jgi:hypothetical protein